MAGKRKRQIKKLAKQWGVQEAVAPPQLTVQQAFDVLAAYLRTRAETMCYFVDYEWDTTSIVRLYNADKSMVIYEGGGCRQ